MFGDDWRWLEMIVNDWRWFKIVGGNWRCLEMIEDDWRWLEMIGDNWRWLEIVGDNWRWLKIIGDNWRWLKMIGDQPRKIMGNRFIFQKKTYGQSGKSPVLPSYHPWRHVFASIQHEFHQLHVPFGRGVVKGSATCGVGGGTAGDVAGWSSFSGSFHWIYTDL